MGVPDPEHHPFEKVAASFLERHRRGDNPEIAAYQREYPELAEEIGELFPSLLLLEDLSAVVGGPASPPPLERLGEYRIIREIGRGGMGVVYEAEQESLGRRVALKVLLFPSLLDPTRLERFRREARAAAGLRHRNIVPVYATGEHQGIHYFVMELIRGRNLQEILDEERQARGGNGPPAGRPLSRGTRFQTAARVALQVAEALAYAHQEGVLHRDLKPSNLLLDSEGTSWLTDFGLAKREEAGGLTGQGDWIGTLRYMPPERFEGWSDHRSDLYSLGVTLYEMLTLSAAFPDQDRARLIQRVTGEAVPAPRRADPEIPRDLETIVLKTTEKEPGHRYQTAADLVADLRCFLADRPISARRSTALERSWRWCRRNRAFAALGASVLLLLVTIAIGSLVAALRLNDSLERARTAEKFGRESLRGSYLAQARASRGSRRAGQRFGGLEAVKKAAEIRPDLKVRDEAVAFTALVDLREHRRLELGPGVFAAFDDDLERYAVCDGQGTISVRRMADDREIAALPGSGHPVWRIEFSPGGRFLATRSHDESGSEAICQVWEAGGSSPILNLPVGEGEAMAFSPDGREVAVGHSQELSIFSLPEGERSESWEVDRPFSAAFHPRERILAVASRGTGRVRLLNLKRDREFPDLPPREEVRGIAWHPRGRMLAVASGRRICLWDWETRRETILRGHQGQVIDLCFSHAGHLLVSRSYDGTTRLWDPNSAQELVAAPGVYRQPRFSGDDRLLAAYEIGAGALGIWEVLAGRGWRCFQWGPGQDGILELDLSPDGRILAAGGRQAVKLWDLTAGTEIGTVPQQQCRSVSFHPCGDLITSGMLGLQRWPFSRPGGGVLRVGPPRKLYGQSPSVSASSRVSRDGAVVAFVADHSRVVLLEEGVPERRLEGHDRVAYIDFSPDNRYVATGSWKGNGVWIWNAADGKIVTRLPVEGSAQVAFSPDGRWLASESESAFEFFDTDGWRRDRSFPGFHRSPPPVPPCFSGDGSMLVIADSLFGLRLLNAATGERLALLEPPNLDVINLPRFSKDGARLAVLVQDRVQVWDLRRVRESLRPLGLDWDLPACPPEEPGESDPLRLEVDAGE